MHERQGCVNDAVNAVSERGGEDLLRRHIGDERKACAAGVVAAGPDVRLGKLDVETCAEGVLVIERGEVQIVELCDAAFEQRHMLMPACDGVALAADADGGEDRVPELVHRLLLGKSGEDLLRPARNGDGRDTPGAGIGHYGAYVRLDGRLAAARARQAVGVYAEQRLRITGGDIEKCCALVSIAVEHFCLPGGKDVEHGVIRAQKALAFKKIIRPAHHDFAAADVIGSGGAQACKIRALDRAADHDGLTLLHIQTDFDEEFCIFSELFFHE